MSRQGAKCAKEGNAKATPCYLKPLMKGTTKKVLSAFVMLACVFAGSTWSLYNHVPLITFKPVHMGDGQSLETQTTPMTEKQADSVVATLKKYNEKYRRQNDITVLITPKLSQDHELIWNYTTKSQLK
ncbi:MAG: hypothetical protein AB8C95_03595 [Phycisphaeraceae bacterium]